MKGLVREQRATGKAAFYFIINTAELVPGQGEAPVGLMAAISQFFEVAQQVGRGFRIELWGTQTPLDRKVKIIDSAKSAPTAPFLFPSRSEGADDWNIAGESRPVGSCRN